MQTLRDHLQAIANECNPSVFPDGFETARVVIRAAISEVETEHSAEALLAVLITETVPRLIEIYGPQTTGIILTRLGASIASGAAPNCARQ
jgi:hypothetical protein